MSEDPQQKKTSSKDNPAGSASRRVGSSASSLLKDAVLHTQPEQLITGLSSAFASSSKGGQSTASPGSFYSTSEHLQAQRYESGNASSIRYDESFRTQAQTHQALSVPHEFDSFMTDSDKLLEPEHRSSSYGNFQLPRRNGKHRAVVEEDGAAVVELLADPIFSPNGTPHSGFAATMEEKRHGISKEDGAAVVALLAGPTFDIDEPPSNASDRETEDAIYLHLHQSEEFQQLLARFKSIFPSAAAHQNPSPANPLNLLPDFSNADHCSKAPFTKSTDRTFGETERAITNSLEPWLDVLTSYKDHVWGDLLPLVRDARQEVNGAVEKGAQASYEGPAIRRLGMILNHIRDLSEAGKKLVKQ